MAASRHAAAWIDPVFQDEFAHGRRAWCVTCHAPAAPDPAAPEETDVRVTQGIGCTTCHVRDGRMVSSSRSPRSPHRTLVDGAFGSPASCAGCHDFNFPILDEHGRLVRSTDEPMQATVAQWRRTGGDLECADCHASTPSGHLFPGSHDPEMVARAVTLSACRRGKMLVLGLENRGAGHHVPSGGVHRHMVLRAWRPNAPERMVEDWYGRRFLPLQDGGKTTIADTTLPPGRTAELLVDPIALGGGTGPVQVELRYVYAKDERAALPPEEVSAMVLRRALDLDELPRCP